MDVGKGTSSIRPIEEASSWSYVVIDSFVLVLRTTEVDNGVDGMLLEDSSVTTLSLSRLYSSRKSSGLCALNGSTLGSLGNVGWSASVSNGKKRYSSWREESRLRRCGTATSKVKHRALACFMVWSPD